MGRSQETFNKKEVRNKKEKKRKEKEKKKLARKESDKPSSLDDMIAYVDENGMISDTPPDPNQKKRETKLEDIEISIPKRNEREELDPIRKGIVSFYNDSKGYGFIKDSETHESVFVHINNTLEEIKEGNVVTFEVEMGQKGPTAVKVKQFK
jgi:cold shock CspA family protein